MRHLHSRWSALQSQPPVAGAAGNRLQRPTSMLCTAQTCLSTRFELHPPAGSPRQQFACDIRSNIRTRPFKPPAHHTSHHVLALSSSTGTPRTVGNPKRFPGSFPSKAAHLAAALPAFPTPEPGSLPDHSRTHRASQASSSAPQPSHHSLRIPGTVEH